jgi:RNA polymerase sigma factor for flagellar operon FliA
VAENGEPKRPARPRAASKAKASSSAAVPAASASPSGSAKGPPTRSARPTGARPTPPSSTSHDAVPKVSTSSSPAISNTSDEIAAIAATPIPVELEPETKKSLPPPTKDMSRKELAAQYQPYVRSIAGNVWKTLSKDIDFEDLVQYGMMGLFEAADRFDAKYGANFMTFAYYRIRGAIYDGLRGMGWVSRSEYQRIRFEARANAFLSNMHDRELAPVGTNKSEETRRSTDEEVGELADVVSSLVTIYVTALDAMEGFQIKDDRGPPIDESLEVLQSRKLVMQAVEKLPEQERKLIQLYYYNELSLEEVGKHLGLSKSWTSRLHTRAIDKMSRLLKDLLDEYAESTGQVPKGKKATQPTEPAGR